ncbi:MAG: hypothetical protein ABL311_11325 [Nitratireductor rhodophyticola]|uniref:hypothetical protein n=1 Tax=Nitratireductor rhodophyticola TaxID=2854036 RepID=UPI0032D92833
MACASYLTRREGRYYLQVRLGRTPARLLGKQLYRVSLRTSNYREARIRLSEHLGWIHRMNDSVDYVSLFQKNVRQLETYLQQQWPITSEQLQARQNFEELLKNLNRRALAANCDPSMLEPEYHGLFNIFVQQNVEAETYLRQQEKMEAYERGRKDVLHTHAQTSVPPSFLRGRSVRGTARPEAHVSLSWPDPTIGHGPEVHGARQPAFDHAAPEPVLREPEPIAPVFDEPPSPAPASAPATSPEPDLVPEPEPVSFSKALEEYLEQDIARGGNADARSVVKLIVQFLIDIMDDPVVAEFDGDRAAKLDRVLPDIPNRRNVPREHAGTLAGRYRYAQKHGWDDLTRLTEARLRNGYHNALSKFFGWLIERGYYPHPKPVFKHVSNDNLVSLPRDSFDDSEIEKIFSQPLFTGCLSDKRIWQPGKYFIQSHLYWGYLLLLLTGLRPGELGQLELNDIVEKDGIHYLYLRGFDPAKGRVAKKDVKRYKTPSSQRVIPLHPLILDLGLLERIEELKQIGCPYLFPEWEPYLKPDGEIRWGQPITKSWQHLKEKLGITRSEVTLYSTRHWFADLIDNTDLKDTTRKRLMGHSRKSDIPARYGGKNRLTTRDLLRFEQAASPALDAITPVLLEAKEKADAGELVVLKPWLQERNWSEYYQEKMIV